MECRLVLNRILHYASPDSFNQGPSSCCIERCIPIIGISGYNLVGRHRPRRLPSGLVESKLKTCIHPQTLDLALTNFYISLGLSLVLRFPQEFQLSLQQAKPQNLQHTNTQDYHFNYLLSDLLLLSSIVQFRPRIARDQTTNLLRFPTDQIIRSPLSSKSYPDTTGRSTLMSVDIRQSLHCLRFPSRYETVSRSQLSRQHTSENTRPAEP